MPKPIWSNFAGKRVLLLQGPVGGFFQRVANALEAHGAHSVRKLNFNGGDWLFFRSGDNYRGSLAEWPAYLAQYAQHHCIDAIVLFGDCRPIHRAAVAFAALRGLACWVFEEGYVRPNHVTFEKHGVNGYSMLALHELPVDAPAETARLREHEVGGTFWPAAWRAMTYYLTSAMARVWFPHPVHHRPLNPLEGLLWLRGYWRKCVYRVRDREMQTFLVTAASKRYFLAPLQVAGDSQVRTHSRFNSVGEFLGTVVASFAAHGPADTLLVVKHHPMDRGYHDYSQELRALAARHGLGDRLVYVHDLHLPTLLEHARGVVLINSTVGMSALHHGTPVITLGKAIYDRQGLTYQGTLDAFWADAPQHAPKPSLYRAFRNHVIAQTQLNGSFYKVLADSDESGLVVPGAVQRPSLIGMPSTQSAGIGQ
jgi:capsular polysaccharide export protein